MKYTEIEGNLFTADDYHALAHCISIDCAMGAGIATEFVRRFPKMKRKLLKKKRAIGDAIVHEENDRVTFNLFTKEKYYHKPTPETFKMSIQSLRKRMDELGIKKLAIPLLGAGIDKLSWEDNRIIIQEIFDDSPIEITVYVLKKP